MIYLKQNVQCTEIGFLQILYYVIFVKTSKVDSTVNFLKMRKQRLKEVSVIEVTILTGAELGF